MLHTLAGAVVLAAMMMIAAPGDVAESTPWACSMQCHPVDEGEFEIVDVVAGNAGKPTVTATLTNTGDRAISVHGTVSFFGLRGQDSAGPFPAAEVVTITPGGTALLMMTLGNAPSSGRWILLVEVRSGSILRTTSLAANFTPISGDITHRSADAMFIGTVALGIITILGAFASWIVTRRLPDVSALSPKSTN